MPSKKGATKADPKPQSEPEVQEEKPVEVEENKEDIEETKAPEDAAAPKRGRGRPKKDGSEPSVKKPKKVKERTEPSRVSRRVANMKTGVTEPEIVTEEPKKKAKKVSKKAPTEEEEKEESNDDLPAPTNGTTEETVSS